MLGLHFSDSAFGAGCVSRRIQNFVNYPDKSPLGAIAYLPTAAAFSVASGAAKELHACAANALACKLGDQDSREVTYTVFPSDRPELWVRFTLRDCAKVDPVRDGDAVTYRNALDGVDVRLQVAPGRIKETVIVNNAKATPLRWQVEMAEGLTMAVRDDIAVWWCKDERVMETRAPWGQDASKTAPTIDGKQRLRATLAEDHGDLVLTLLDLDKATLPAEYDPTVMISGTSAIATARIITGSGYDNLNGGGCDDLVSYHGGGIYENNLINWNKSLIPTGTITGFSYFVYGSNGGTVYVYAIVDGNTWVRGTSIFGASQAGACCGAYAKYDTQAWAGGVGSCCTVSGVDFIADASPPALTVAVGSATSVALKTAWVNQLNGVCVFSSVASFIRWYTALYDAPYGHYFTIDYTVGGLPLSLIGAVE